MNTAANHVAAFTVEDANRAYDEWGANCGPGAIAGVMNMTLEQVRPHLQGFDQKRYTNPMMMYAALNSLSAQWCKTNAPWPKNGLVRIQWEGPWTAPGVPARAAYRHTHWVGSRVDDYKVKIFDINCMCVGGWVPLAEWSDQVVPWLLKELKSKGDGKWHSTHRIEVVPA